MAMEKFGEWAFLACVGIAVLAGLAVGAGQLEGQTNTITALLLVLGAVVGLTTVTEKETTPFLVAAVALVTAGTVSYSVIHPTVGMMVDKILDFIGVFVAPAAVLVAFKAVYALASKK